MPKISIKNDLSRYKSIYSALELLRTEIKKEISGKKKIVIKVNFVDSKNIIYATNPYAVKAVLDFLKTITDQKIVIAEAPFSGSMEMALKNFHYYEILDGYNIDYVDLNRDETERFTIKDPKLRRSYVVNLAKTIIESDFRISVTPPKTHDTFIVTLGLKNLAVGSTIVPGRFASSFIPVDEKHWRLVYHKGLKDGNILISQVCKKVWPNLNILDGWQGIEGNGPTHGSSVDWQIAIAGLDALAVDWFVTSLMGFNPNTVGYLYYLKKERLVELDIEKMEIVGEKDLKKFQKHFIPHKSYKEQLRWMSE